MTIDGALATRHVERRAANKVRHKARNDTPSKSVITMNETAKDLISLAHQTAERLLNDVEFRARLRAKDPAALQEMGFSPNLPAGDPIEYKVVAATRDTMYVTMPPALSEDALAEPLEAGELSQLQGGNCASTAGSAGTAGTVSSICSTASSASSALTVGSAGSVAGRTGA